MSTGAGHPRIGRWVSTLEGKIDLLCRIMDSGNKADSHDARLWITEVNWPLKNTGRFAPALGDSRVGEREQLFFLVRYYLIALATGSVAAVFWHQLIAPGYGLVDNRDGIVRKRPAFHGFETLCRLFNGAAIEDFSRQDTIGHYQLHRAKGRYGDSRVVVQRSEIDSFDARGQASD